jgi:hypothetical protein
VVKNHHAMKRKVKDLKLRRINRQQIMFNEKEMNAINHFCEKFKVDNKSKFMREAIITEILRKFDDNYPTLWEDNQLRLF